LPRAAFAKIKEYLEALREPPVLLALDPVPDPSTADPVVANAIEVELPTGIKLRVTGEFDEASLRRILSALS
jgi:hypothetical protein